MGIKSTSSGSNIGDIKPHAGASIPAGWLQCGGQAVSRATYSALFIAIGTAYGAGDGLTTFNLPDIRGRVLFGKDNMGGTAANRVTTGGGGLDGVTLGAAGGGQTVTLTTADIPAHNHPQLTNAVSGPGTSGGGIFVGSLPGAGYTTDTRGFGGAHSNIPPSIVVNYIIKT